nr:MAG TPA: Na+ dependent nucleoside transporter N-terminus [Caudoviricetes sp.]
MKISWFSSRKRKHVPWRTTKCEYRLIHTSPTGDE